MLSDNIISKKRVLHRMDTTGKQAGLKLKAKKSQVKSLEKHHQISN